MARKFGVKAMYSVQDDLRARVLRRIPVIQREILQAIQPSTEEFNDEPEADFWSQDNSDSR